MGGWEEDLETCEETSGETAAQQRQTKTEYRHPVIEK